MLCDLVGLIVILTWLLLYETYSELLLKNRIRFRYYSQYIPYGPLISENTSDECVAKSSGEFCVEKFLILLCQSRSTLVNSLFGILSTSTSCCKSPAGMSFECLRKYCPTLWAVALCVSFYGARGMRRCCNS